MFQPLSAYNFSGMDAKAAAIAKLNVLADNVDTVLTQRKADGFLFRAAKAWQKGRYARAAQLAFEAVETDDSNALAYHVLALALEKMGYLYKALVTYQKAYELNPDDPDIIINLGLLASKFNMMEIAKKLNRKYIDRCPDAPLGYNNLSFLLGMEGHVDEAIELLRGAITRMPEEPMLWNALAIVLMEEGRVEECKVFSLEAIRLNPKKSEYYHNLAFAYTYTGKLREAISLCGEALENVTDPIERLESLYLRGTCRLNLGELEEGFKEYAVHNKPLFRCHVEYIITSPKWEGEPLAGKRVVVVTEQGLGDEIMFANIFPDLLRAVGPEGKLVIAATGRLIPLFKRSWPEAEVYAYDDRKIVNHDGNVDVRLFPFLKTTAAPDCYGPQTAFLSHFRKRLEDFSHQAYLKPDPARVAAFRNRLNAGGKGPVVGICWRSMLLAMKRGKFYSHLTDWGPILKTDGVRFLNLQYGECEQELAEAENLFGIKIERMEGHDLTDDIDGNAALSAALDLVISAPTAVAATSAAVGTETWFLLSYKDWPQLGTDEYPWYPKTRIFVSKRFADWPDATGRIADALKGFVAAY